MYKVKKQFEISASHKLYLDYDSPCQEIHGHNWKITVFCRSKELDNNGMVIDFSEIKRLVHGQLDHKHLNKVLQFNPTAENIAKWIVDTIPTCYKAIVEESTNNEASYEKV
jgi:6-pyruvoyltetrahydropterin/6-carboxytetrahydropterin synthase